MLKCIDNAYPIIFVYVGIMMHCCCNNAKNVICLLLNQLKQKGKADTSQVPPPERRRPETVERSSSGWQASNLTRLSQEEQSSSGYLTREIGTLGCDRQPQPLRSSVKQVDGVRAGALDAKPLDKFVEANLTWCGKGLVEPSLNRGAGPHILPLPPARG